MGVQGAYKYDNLSDYVINGNGNIVYLGIGYVLNLDTLRNGETGFQTGRPMISDLRHDENLTPVIQLGTQTGAVRVNGNGNVGLMFENLYRNFHTGDNLPYNSLHDFRDYVEVEQNGWAKSVIGIYQGEIEMGMKIGETS